MHDIPFKSTRRYNNNQIIPFEFDAITQLICMHFSLSTLDAYLQ